MQIYVGQLEQEHAFTLREGRLKQVFYSIAFLNSDWENMYDDTLKILTFN